MGLPVALTPGTTIGGHYIVGSLINRGGFGAVYRGVDTSEGRRPCAIKETYDVTPAARRQALMEAGVLFTVRSNHLPEVYDAFEANGRFYLVMQLIEGQNLLQLLHARIGSVPLGMQQPHLLSQGPCSEQEVLAWLLPIMDVLQELHSRNPAVMHRDIKPGNIVLTPQQSAVLVDFGLTKLYDPQSSTQSLVKAVSEGFSPLEQYLGKTSPQSDIYSMAATMYLLLTNRLPPAATARRVNDTLIPPRLINPALSPKMERALLRALAVNADQRYLNMREFAQALTQSSFNAHADRTIAVAPVTGKQTIPVRSYAGVAGRPAQQQGVARPFSPSSTPRPAAPVYAPPPQKIPSYIRPLPGSSSQGCLWGVVQGILAAVLVLLLKREPYFYLTILMGFAFYALAGFMTTRRGGASIRGAWAGAWAGVISTVIFWIVLFIGLVFAFVQRLQAITGNAQRHGIAVPSSAAGRAWRAILPDFLTHQTTPGQSATTAILIALAIGLVIAFTLGWIGGALGRSRHKTFMLKLRQPLTF
jgi:serine/threonine protein kinase